MTIERYLKFSNRWHWYNNKLQNCSRKLSNQQKDFQHKLSKKLIQNTKAQTLILGDINVKEMCSTNNLSYILGINRSTSNSGVIGRFRGFLTYKANLKSKPVIRISESRTSKRYYYCGNKENRRLSERIINCDKCGIVIDRSQCKCEYLTKIFSTLFAITRTPFGRATPFE